ncbi:putative [pyruvate dehydrogenase (acetyl-transferring)] kinase, mitochondrial, partial [Trichinella spiralis]
MSDLFLQQSVQCSHVGTCYSHLSLTELFHKILPVEKIEGFTDKSQRYALQKGVNSEVHVEVLMQFFGLILLSGYYSVLNENHFWSTADDVCVSIVPRVMARNKFKNVKRYFHLVDNSKLKKDDLMGNIKLLYDYLNQKLLQFGVFQEKLTCNLQLNKTKMRLTVLLRSVSQGLHRKIDSYSHYRPIALNLQQLLNFAKEGGQLESYTYLQKELLVRFANTMKEIECLPAVLQCTSSLKTVKSWFSESFSELFTEAIKKIYYRHMHVVETVAEGIMDIVNHSEKQHLVFEKHLNYFLNRFYLMRISNRMLINQHIMRFAKLKNDGKHTCDRIDPDCDVAGVLEVEDEGKPIRIAYIPSHLFHITFELLKNALRAVVEHHGNKGTDSELPPVQVTIYKGKVDLSLKIHDEGGGIPRMAMDKLFAYHYTTAPKPVDRCPMAGLGYGLPLSRLYAWYFHGDMTVVSFEGFGTDACIYLKALAENANELLPLFNPAAKKFYENTSHSPWIRSPGHDIVDSGQNVRPYRFFPPLSTPDLPKKFFSNPFSECREKVTSASKNGKPYNGETESLSSGEKALTNNAEITDDSCNLSITDEVGSLQNNNGSTEDNLENRSRICVAIRVRPVLETDPDKMPYCNRVVHVNQKLSSIRIMKGKVGQEFKFSHCFDSNSQQEDIFNELSEPLITQLLRGINCTLMAYGQTGSGKTYSMMGSSTKPGIIPRICEKLKIRLCENEPEILSKLKMSYYEIYNEKIYDLLADGDKSCSLKVREDPKTGAFVDGLRAIEVDKNADILHLIAVGNKRRMMAATRNNNHSSRSHVILSLKLVQNDSSNKILYSLLNLVDLAGSESGATSERLDETSSINKSLHCLGRVIQQLRDGSAHISYRDSVLTRLLKESLGGNALTTLLATVTPLHAHIEQTLNTLRYANFAREVVNYVQINEASTVNENQLVTAMLQSKLEYEHKIKELYMLLRMYKNNAVGQMNCDFESVSDTTVISEKTLTGDSITSLTAESELDVEVLDSPYLLWLSSESDLNFSAISLPLKLGSNKIGCDSAVDIVVEGTMLSGVECTVFRSVEDVIHVVPEIGKELYVNGKQVTTLTMLNYGDRLCLAGEHFLKLCSMNTVPKLNPGELQDAKLEFLMSQNQRLILQLANAAAHDIREEIKETDVNNTPSKANFATQTDSVENFQMVNKPLKFDFSHLLNHNLNALFDLELFVREANYLCKCWNVPYSYTVQCDPGFESEIPTLTVVMHNDIMKTDVDLSADYFSENWLILRSLQQSKKRSKFNDQMAKMFYQAKSGESVHQHQMPDPQTQSQSETATWEQSSENAEPSEQNRIVASETWDSFAERNSKNCTNSKTILDWFLLSARNFHGLLVNLLKNNESEGCYLSKRKKGQLLVGFQNLHIYGQVMAEMPNSFPESAFLIGQLDAAMNNCFAALLTFIQVIKNDEFVTNDRVNSVIRMLLKVFETVGCLCFVLPTVGASHTFKGNCSNCKLSETLYGALFKGLYNGFKKMAAVVGNMIDSENSHVQRGQRETLRRMCLFNSIEKLRCVLKECKRNSEYTNQAICNTAFRIIRPMMHSVELFSCGNVPTLDDVTSFLLVFYAESVEGLFLDCIGVLIPSRNSTSYTDIAVTSRYCLQYENIEHTKVMTYESFNQGYETGFINRIADIYVPGKNDTNRAKWQAPPNIAIIKLRIPIAFKYNVQPICLPEVNEIITVDHRCFFYRFSRIGYTVSYFMPLGLKVLPHEYCKMMIGSSRLDSSTQLCCEERNLFSTLHTEFMYNMVPDGSSLICKKRDTFYFFGVQDWIWFPKPRSYPRPIVIFTAISAFTDSSNCGRSGLVGGVLAYTMVFFGEAEGRMFVDCIGLLVPSSNSSYSDIVVTSRYCVQFRSGTNRSRTQPPPNISLIKMRLPILSSFYTQPVCLPEEHDYPSNEQECVYYRFYYVGGAKITFLPISMKQITDKHCKSIIGNSRKDNVSQMCFEEQGPHALLKAEFSATMIPTGFPLICLKHERSYLYGIQDWLRFPKPGENLKPIAIFTATSPFAFRINRFINETIYIFLHEWQQFYTDFRRPYTRHFDGFCRFITDICNIYDFGNSVADKGMF